MKYKRKQAKLKSENKIIRKGVLYMYDFILLGATFAAAGIAKTCKGSCLILESRPQAGYEFISALHFGTDYYLPVKSSLAQSFHKTFLDRQAISPDRICLFDCAAPFYQLLEGIPILLNTQILCVEKKEKGFLCTVHGVSGYRTFEATQIIDTRCAPEMCVSKTYNLLIDGTGPVTLPPDVFQEPWGFSHNYILRCSVPLDANYLTARKIAMDVLNTLPPSHKLVLLADDFDYQVKGSYPQTKGGILQLPSKSYRNPILALDAGACLTQGVAL